MIRMRPCLVSLVVVAFVALAACTGETSDAPQTPSETRGGAAALPGTVPTGMKFSNGGPSSPPAPDFALPLMDGTQVTGSQLWRERPVVLFFFASWCGTCAEQQANLSALAENFGDAVVFLGVTGEDDPRDIADFLEENDVDNAVALDPELGTWRNYAVREPPHVVVIAKGGRVFRGWPRPIPRSLLSATLEELGAR